LLKPVFEGYDESPKDIGWVRFLKDYTVTFGKTKDCSDFDYDALHDHLVRSTKKKDIFIMFSDLQKEIAKLNIMKVYEKLQFVLDIINEKYSYVIGKRIIRRTLHVSLTKIYARLKNKFDSSKNNDVSSVRYYSERFQGFIIRKKSRVPGLKPTTIKLFAKGKINIDHAKSPSEARYIYYWLNDLLLKNEELTFDPDIHPDDLDPDDEWSYTDTEDMSEEDEITDSDSE
jgi:hypothetical protein